MAGQVNNLCPSCLSDGFDGECLSCGYNPENSIRASFALPALKVLNSRYIIGKILGSGGFGVTYLARDVYSGALYAVKEFLPSEIAVRDTANFNVCPSNQSNRDIYKHGIDRFVDEAKVLANLSENNSVVKVFDCFNENGTAYVVMEFLDGVTLKTLSKSMGGIIPLNMAIDMLIHISQVMAEVHKKGILHRDISPENIFVTSDGNIKLIDFGAARYFVGEHSRSLSVVLKPGFAPPEQYSSKGIQGPWTDIYALAGTFYCVVSGEILPDSLDRINGGKLKKLSLINTEISAELSGVIEKALELNYKNRIQSMEEFSLLIFKAVSSGAGSVKSNKQPDFSRYQPFISLSNLKKDKWIIPKDTPIVIGRSLEQCNIIINGFPNISRVHCVMWFDTKESAFCIKDYSSNGTFLETGKRLERETTHKLAPSQSFYLSSRDCLLTVGLEQ